VSIVSATEPFDSSTALGKLVFGFLANWGAFETELIRERALLGFERRVREAKWTGAHVPFGYRRASGGKLEIEANEAQVIKTMHEEYGRLGGDAQLARWLNSRSIPMRGSAWTPDRVRRVLTNPIAVGRLEVRGLSQQHTDLAVLPVARFDQTAKLRSSLRHLGKHRPVDERQEAIDRVFDAYLAELQGEGEEATEEDAESP
jgi:site-specific DNA recombinase